jgi:hypothetical protein
MEEQPIEKSAHRRHHEENWPMNNWRAWGSWFSWGSPIGLSLFYAIVLLSTGVFIWLIHIK